MFGVNDLADLIAGNGDDSGPVEYARIEPATVVAIAPTGATDGNPLVTVSWRGVELAAPYVSPPGDWGATGVVVAVLVAGSQLVILGRLRGTPPDS